MRSVEPEVYLVAKPKIDYEAIAAYTVTDGTWVPGWRKV
jgi:hypothetical protein